MYFKCPKSKLFILKNPYGFTVGSYLLTAFLWCEFIFRLTTANFIKTAPAGLYVTFKILSPRGQDKLFIKSSVLFLTDHAKTIV